MCSNNEIFIKPLNHSLESLGRDRHMGTAVELNSID